MLLNLHIENYALIDQLDLDFSEGFSVITGETGAGKSILLGALSLILGQRADSKAVREGAGKCVTEATFLIGNYGLERFFEENDLEFDPKHCIIRRELFENGKSRSFVNDSPVALNILKDLSNKLIDIHSQHQNLLLGNDAFQRDVLDAVAGNAAIRNEYREAYRQLKDCQQQLKKLEEKALKSREEEDFIRFQYNQLMEASLKKDEQSELEAEQNVLTHAEDIKTGLSLISGLLDNDENGILQLLKNALNTTNPLTGLYPALTDAGERFQTAYVDLKDLKRDIDRMLDDVDVDPARLQWINDRLDVFYTLQQKHRVDSVAELLEIQQELSDKLNVLDSFDEEIARLNTLQEEALKRATELACALSESRKGVSSTIEKKLINQLRQLGMPKAIFEIKLDSKPLDSDGTDVVRFLFSANLQSSPQPIDRIASGGEISRIMLSIKALIAEYSSLPTLLFDEIDTGVSGEIAHKMGEIMRSIAVNRQVLCITHLPQIASKGTEHFKVLKKDTEGRTVTQVNKLTSDERLNEIAAMLSGANLTEAALQNARQLMQESNI